MEGNAIGFAFAFIVSFLLGLIFSVLGCVAILKFVEWMRGRSMIFTPWPRLHANAANHDSIVNNNTYEMDNGNREPAAANLHPARAHMDSSSLLTRLERNGKDAMEEVEEPINEEEHNLEVQQSHALPYAVHAYLGEVPVKDTPKPVIKKSNDCSQASNSSGTGEHANKIKPHIPWKLVPVHGDKLQLDADHKNYSALDKKARYACLEPHTGEGTAVIREDAMMRESYSYLNH